MTLVEPWQLRAEFARRLSVMYGEEVPAYNTLVDVSTAVNLDFIERHGADAERLGSIGRVTAERHGAIRVGSAAEMAQVARVFAAFGMYPVGFYDLRDASSSSVPVVSTAFRPVGREELAKNPFRVFTSMLASEDPRFFSPEMQRRLAEVIGNRTIFSEQLLSLADAAVAQNGLESEQAEQLLEHATGAFRLTSEPVDFEWYKSLEKISAVAADIGGVTRTHINHLTPRVLDIDDLYRRMEALGIVMIDEIQGPPDWQGPDVLLRQTSFRALAEERMFTFADGTVGPGELRVRFGEVEQRGIALTPSGRELYDRMVATVDERLAAAGPDARRVDIARKVWQEFLPPTERELEQRDLAFFSYRVDEKALAGAEFSGPTRLSELLLDGIVVAEPIVYEDFLPRSAAGIFQSNLSDDGSKDEGQTGVHFDIDRMSDIIGSEVREPHELYARQRANSLLAVAARLGLSPTELTHSHLATI